ncbi:MAG: glutamate--tRNA ligase [Planctomycetota bacterium]|jgi:glutamyl-tRNA synthetase
MLSQSQSRPVKTRFAPSPTGWLHVGGARTALFNYLLARQSGGTFLLRIEDTDRARHDESAVGKIIQDLQWMGIQWDEGVEVGGDSGPYRQSERLDIYREHVDRLLAEGKAYYAFETPEELDVLRKEAEAAKTSFRYSRPAAIPTADEAERARAEGRPVVVRFMCPDTDVTIIDEVFGEVTMPADQLDDFVIMKADGYPVYHLANVVDDELMGVTLICRGQEFLGQSWRQKALREAFGFAEPRYGHLPLIMDMQGRKLSKRDGAVEVHSFRQAGYSPEGLLSFLALLGWNPGTDQETFTLDELVELFSLDRIGKSNAKFDRDKLLAFNTDALAAADDAALLAGLKDFLSLNETPIPANDDALLATLVTANKGMRTFEDVIGKCGALFGPDDAIVYDPKAVAKVLDKNEGAGYAVLADLKGLFAEADWSPEPLEELLTDYCETNELGVGKVAQPIRVAVTGATVSPAIFDTLMILGKDKTLARIERCLSVTRE